MLVYLQAGQLSIHFKGKQQYYAKAISNLFKDTVLKRNKEKKNTRRDSNPRPHWQGKLGIKTSISFAVMSQTSWAGFKQWPAEWKKAKFVFCFAMLRRNQMFDRSAIVWRLSVFCPICWTHVDAFLFVCHRRRRRRRRRRCRHRRRRHRCRRFRLFWSLGRATKIKKRLGTSLMSLR